MAGRALEQDCRTCRRVPSVRSKWGCDGPSPQPFAYLTCERCAGYDPKCDLCRGDPRGRPHHDCPNRVLTADHTLALTLHSMFEANGSLPSEGGILDQTDAWLVSMRIIGAELAIHRETERQSWQREAFSK